jgi:hypothetical protein
LRISRVVVEVMWWWLVDPDSGKEPDPAKSQETVEESISAWIGHGKLAAKLGRLSP